MPGSTASGEQGGLQLFLEAAPLRQVRNRPSAEMRPIRACFTGCFRACPPDNFPMHSHRELNALKVGNPPKSQDVLSTLSEGDRELIFSYFDSTMSPSYYRDIGLAFLATAALMVVFGIFLESALGKATLGLDGADWITIAAVIAAALTCGATGLGFIGHSRLLERDAEVLDAVLNARQLDMLAIERELKSLGLAL